jgi:hypothetical protein
MIEAILMIAAGFAIFFWAAYVSDKGTRSRSSAGQKDALKD